MGIKLPEELVATALESREGFEGKPMEADAIWKRLEEQHGIKRGGAVELINDPKAEAAGRILLDKEGKPIGIELNQVRLATQAQIDWVLQHEAAHWFDVTNPKITEDILRTVPDAEWEGVFNNVVKLGYSTEKVPYEISARSIQQLADAWKGRGWFDKLVGNVQRFAHETLGIKMTRRAAESTAVRAIAQSIKRIGETAATKPDVSAAMAAWRQRTAAPKPVEPAPSMAVVRRGEMGIGQPVEEKFPRTKRFLRHMGDVERTLSQIKPGDKIEYIDPDGRIVESNFVRFEERDTPDGISSFAVLKDAVSGKEYGVEAEILAEHHLQPMAKQFEDIRESLESSIRMAERPGDYANPELAKEYRDRLNALRSRVIDVEATPMSFEARMPGIESAEDIKKGVQSLMLPSAKSPEHLRAAELLASKLGPMHHRGEVAANKLSQWSKAFDKLGVHREDVPLPENTGIQFMSAMSQGKPLSGPKAQAASELIQKLFAERIDALEKAGAPLETVRENYFPGMWTRESRLAFNAAMEKLGEGIDVNNATAAQKEAIKSLVDQYLAEGVGSEKDALGYLTRRPMKGKESFRKQKVFDDIMDGVEFGLRPVSNNPIDLVQLKLAEMDRSIMANEYFKALKDKGELKVIPPGREIPEGWQKVNDRYGTIYGPPVEGVFGRRIMGYRIVPEAHGDIINNYLSSSLYNNRYFGPLYKGWMSLANALNQTQLGMGSAFHGGFTTGEAQISAGANVLKDIYGVLRGNRSVKDLGRSVAKASMATVQNPIIGDRVLNAWRERDAQINPRIAQVVKAAELAGAGFKLETGLRTEQSTKLLRDWYSGNRLKAAARSPVALTELLAKPIMEYLVPRQKAGVFADLAWRIIEQNPGRSLEELTPQFRQAWNRVDARLGQVRYDRLFINNTAKNVVQGLVRAPGWSGGTIAEIGGGFADAGKFLSEWVKTGRLPQNIPDRTAYVLSLLTTVMATNAALTYAFTGTKPTGLDYFAFRTGSKDEQGRDERFLIPSYMKDILAYAKHPGQTLINKAHPLIGMISDLIKNRDYYGVEIRSRDAGPVKKAGETVAYVAKGFEPFWTRGTRREVERGAAPVSPRTVAPLVGIMPAPRSVTQTKAEGLAHDLMLERIPAGARTKESAERARLRAEKTKGQDYLTRTVKRLDVESAMRVWNAATPEEKQKIKSEVLSKIGRSRTLTREREQDLKNLVNSAIP